MQIASLNEISSQKTEGYRCQNTPAGRCWVEWSKGPFRDDRSVDLGSDYMGVVCKNVLNCLKFMHFTHFMYVMPQ